MAKIFLSFSGNKSKEKANSLRNLLVSVFDGELGQEDIFFSDKTISPGDNFINTIQMELNAVDVGIIFINGENYLSEPWINYEAGALRSRLPKTTFVLFDGTVNEFSDFTKSKSPLRTIQVQRNNEKRKIFEMFELIKNKLDISTTSSNLYSEFNDSWEMYEQSLSSIQDRYVNNFNQLLRFFVKTTDDLYNKKIKKTDIEVPEIWAPHVNKDGVFVEGNIRKPTIVGSELFKPEWLQFSDEFFISVHLVDESRIPLLRVAEQYIRFVPKNPSSESEYLNIFYYPGVPKLTMRYNLTDSDDCTKFKEHMAQYHNVRNKKYIFDLNIPDNATAYNCFNDMIKHSLLIDTLTGVDKINR